MGAVAEIRGSSAGRDMLRWKVLVMIVQQVERGNGCWVDNWRLIGRFIRVFDAASFSSSY
eukprot:scaffold3388_cov62-Attheya_sp.AAC.4